MISRSLRRLVILPAALSVLSFFAPTHANIAPVIKGDVQSGTPLPTNSKDISVVREKLNITITHSGRYRWSPRVEVIAEYEMKNESAAALEVEMAFPVAGAFPPQQVGFDGFREEKPGQEFDFAVSLDQEPIKATEKSLDLPYVERWGYSGYHWTPRPPADDPKATEVMVRWIKADPELEKLLAEFTKMTPRDGEAFFAYQEFETAVNTAAGRKGMGNAVLKFLLTQDPKKEGMYIGDLAELLAEADPAFREPAGDSYIARLKTDTKLDDETRQKYVQTIDRWLEKSPTIRERFNDVTRLTTAATRAGEFLSNQIGSHLDKRASLSKVARGRLLAYFATAYHLDRQPQATEHDAERPAVPQTETTLPRHAPDLWLAAQIDPAMAAEQQKRTRDADALLDEYGFDSTFLSPLTGKGYSLRQGWLDDSTWKRLGIDADSNSAAYSSIDFIGSPNSVVRVSGPRTSARLLRFAASFSPGQSRTLRVRYQTLLESDDFQRGGFAGNVSHFRYILTTAKRWKSFGPVDLTITMPNHGLAVIDPAPDSGTVSDDQTTVTYHTTVKKIERNLRLAWLPARKNLRCALFNIRGPEALAQLEKLLADDSLPAQARKVLETLRTMAKLQPPADNSPVPLPPDIRVDPSERDEN